jgi:FtsP/CotA-like multicopper oxidase with cupredoxin domain
MSRNQRLGLVALALAVAVVAFVLARPGDDDDDGERAATTQARTTETATETTPTATAEAPPPVTRIQVRGGAAVGGVKRIEVKKGDTVRLRVSSSDTSDEVHVHGYDLKRDMAPGRPVSFEFEAKIEGVFEIELEGAHHQIASLVVEPA